MARDIIANLKFQKMSDPDGFDPLKFAEMMEEAYLSEKRPNEFTQKKTFSPSTVGYGNGNCPRYWFIAFTGAEFENETDAMGVANMANGTYVHERVQKIMAKTPVFRANETEVTHDDPPIRGFADTFIEWNGKEVVLEIKSAKDEIFAIRAAEMQGLPYHKIQLLTYMKIRGAEQGAFYYENKNDQSFLIIPLNMTEKNKELIDGVWDWMRRVYAAYKAETLPERTFTKSTWACKGCPVKKVCWEDKKDLGEVYIEPLVLEK
jgi:CRISPR/Cas system-associated exonuclease Cas4 (RecB family)